MLLYFCVFLTNIVCIGSSNYIFSVLYFVTMHYSFYREVSSNNYRYCAILVQSLSAYATTDRSKKRLVKNDLY